MTMVNALPCRPVRLAAWGWLALHAAALWPHGLWAARRMLDGSDEPLGLAALAALLMLAGARGAAAAHRAAPGLAGCIGHAHGRGHRGAIGLHRRCRRPCLPHWRSPRTCVRGCPRVRRDCRWPAWRCWRCRWWPRCSSMPATRCAC